MGRAGAGGRAGSGRAGTGRSSAGGHSAGRSTGGHRMGGGSSHRAGSGSFGGGGGFGGGGMRGPGPGMHGPGPGPGMHGPGMPPPPPPHHRRYPYFGRRYYGGGYGGGYGGRPYRGSGCLVSLLVVVIVIFCVARLMFEFGGFFLPSSSSVKNSTIVRHKLESQNAYINNCVVDELGWVDNLSKTQSGLKDFWDETGVQPYIILRDYDAALATDSEKQQWASDYYDENFDAEDIFLFVYFAEEDVENDVGYMVYANGLQTSSVMDAEAVEIFWNNIDKYWYTNLSTDDVLVKAFSDTASTIMQQPAQKVNVLRIVLTVIAIAAVIVLIVRVVKLRKEGTEEKEL